MNMKYTPTKGMRDFLPKDVIFREYVSSVITKNYQAWGFQKIETPCLEDISLLDSGDGGENEKLIYKILKRGKKLELNKSIIENDIVDLGLRFDLTIPLSRFFANNNADLLYPFKAIQIGPVWRAERPQKGRYRQFVQCDIDIIGEKGNIGEVSLLSAATDALIELGINDFTIKINDRRILLNIAKHYGFDESYSNLLFVTLDKMDKIGSIGVVEELINKGFEKDKTEKLLEFFESVNNSPSIKEKLQMLPPTVGKETINSLYEIIETYSNIYKQNIEVDFGLVRGMSYYTGPIYEIKVKDFNSSIGGGGRYDGMISKFTNKSEPACGISIGFERIISILKERNFKINTHNKKVALLYSETTSLINILDRSNSIKKEGMVVSIFKKKKNLKHQLEVLLKNDFSFFSYVEDETIIYRPLK